MTTHAPLPDTATISARIAQLPLLPMDSLWVLWDEHFDQRPNHHHRTWLESRLAYKLQERAYGGLKVSVRRKLESISQAHSPTRWREAPFPHPAPDLICVDPIGQRNTGNRNSRFAAGLNNGLLEFFLVIPPAAVRFLDIHGVHYR